MSNKSVSDFVAATMDAVLKSEAHKSLFGTQYKFASDENDAKKCKGCGCSMDKCDCGDTALADDNNDDVPPAKPQPKPPQSEKEQAEHAFDAFKDQTQKLPASPFADKAKADDSYADDEESDESDADDSDSDGDSNAAFDVAIDSLLTASAALDSVGMEKSATFSLKLASLIVEAKKDKAEEKKKKDEKKAKDKEKKEKEKARLQAAKEKAKAKAAKDKAKADAQAAKDKAAAKKKKEEEKEEAAAAKKDKAKKDLKKK